MSMSQDQLKQLVRRDVIELNRAVVLLSGCCLR